MDEPLDYYDALVKRRRTLTSAKRAVIVICALLVLHMIFGACYGATGHGCGWIVSAMVDLVVVIMATFRVRRWNKSINYINNILDELDRYRY